MAQPTIAAVVVAHSLERIEQTCACIESLRANTRPPDELMVVVDQNPMLRRVLTRLVGPPVDLYDNAGDGISAARTTALRHSRSEVLAFVDDDAWVEPDFLDTLGDAFRAPGVIAAGARILPEWEEPARALPAELVWIVGGTYRGHRDDAGPISRPLGAAMAVRRDALAAVGGFHPDFGPRRHRKSSSNEELATFTLVRRHYGDDCIVYVPGAIAHHAAPAARCTGAYVLRRSFVEGTSKADARRLFGAAVMGHDRGYDASVLLPGLARHAWAALGHSPRRPAARALCLDATALATALLGYGSRLISPRRDTVRIGQRAPIMRAARDADAPEPAAAASA